MTRTQQRGADCFQLDHVLVDQATERRLTSWDVDPTPATGPEPLSDHAPILVTLADQLEDGLSNHARA